MTISNCLPHKGQILILVLNFQMHVKNKEETHLSDLSVVFTFRASPSALAPLSDIPLYARLGRKHRCTFLTCMTHSTHNNNIILHIILLCNHALHKLQGTY